ncbi:hypothetical protein CU048_04650 [Beijerinckiaceae bacterium]|nr:hypothetical protein CU048_04650 [Beijerinckiaceae bacterium]
MTRSVAQYLMRFATSDGGQAAVVKPSEMIGPLPEMEVAREDPVHAHRAAREEGMSEGLELARAEYDARIVKEREAFEARLAAERQRWIEQEAKTLSDKIETAFAAVGMNIGESVEKVLRPFIVDALRYKVVDLLTESVTALLRGGVEPVIKIHGAKDLLAALGAKLSGLSAAIEYAPAETVEVEIVSGQTIIETQISAWIERINTLPERDCVRS